MLVVSWVMLLLHRVGAEVVDLTSKAELTSFLSEAKAAEQWVLLDFYAPWCGHCKRLNPILDEFDRGTVRIGKIDATRHKALATAHDVEGYPTLRFSVDTENFRDYKGGRDFESLDHLDIRLSSKAVADPGDDLFALAPFAFVGRDLDSEKSKIFHAVARDRYHEATFGISSTIPKNAIAVVEKDSETFLYTGPLDEKSLKAWVKKHNVPSFASPLGPSIFRRIAASRLTVAAVVDGLDGHHPLSAAVKAALKSQPDLRNDFGAGELDGTRWAEYVATYDVTTLPHLLVIDLPGKRFWNMPSSDFDVSSTSAVVAHLNAIRAGALRPRYLGWKGFPERLSIFYFRNHFLKCNAGIVLLLASIVYLLRSSSSSSSKQQQEKRD